MTCSPCISPRTPPTPNHPLQPPPRKQSKAPLEDPTFQQLYGILKNPNAPPSPSRLSLPGKIHPCILADLRVPLLDSSREKTLLLEEVQGRRLLEGGGSRGAQQGLLSSPAGNSRLLEGGGSRGAEQGLLSSPAGNSTAVSPATNSASSLHQQVTHVASPANAASPLNAHIARELLANEDIFRDVSHQDFHGILKLNAKLGRSAEAEKTFQLMVDAGVQPTVEDYNQLMNSYSSGNDLPNCLRIFKRITDVHLQPDVKSYGILIHFLAKNRRVTDAFRMYEEMKLRNLPITQPIVTSLLKGCSTVGDYNRAWRFFEHIRNQVSRPDELTFNHMIHICAKTGHVERAFTLFHEMLQSPAPDGQGKLMPLESTYLSLIHACAKRPDYYRETFDIVQQMEEAGFRLNRVGYNYLMHAAGLQGDIHRAKALWEEMSSLDLGAEEDSLLSAAGGALSSHSSSHSSSKSSSNSPSHSPSPSLSSRASSAVENSYYQMLECYTRIPSLVHTVWKKTVWQKQMDKWNRNVLEAKMGTENERRMAEGLRPIDINEWMTDDQYDPDERITMTKCTDPALEELRDYLLEGQPEDGFLTKMREEALGFFDQLKKNTATGGRVQLTSSLLDGYVDLLGAYGLQSEAHRVFTEMYPKHGLSWTEKSFVNVIRWSFRKPKNYSQIEEYFGSLEEETAVPTLSPTMSDQPDGDEQNLENAWNAYYAFEKYRTQKGYPDHWHELETKYVRNKWHNRGISHYHRKQEYLLYKYMIQGLTRYVLVLMGSDHFHIHYVLCLLRLLRRLLDCVDSVDCSIASLPSIAPSHDLVYANYPPTNCKPFQVQ